MLINSSVARSGKHLHPVKNPGRWFEQSFSHRSSNYIDEWGEGELPSIVAQRFGSEKAMNESIERGEARRGKTKSGIELVYLPKAAVGHRESFDTEQGGKDMLG